MEKDKKTIKQNAGVIARIKKLLFGNRNRTIITIIAFLIFGFIGWRAFGQGNPKPQYQTAVAEKGTLVSSVSESGQVAVANRANVTTSATGVISEVDVKNGDTVTQGQKIAVVSLDSSGQQKQAQAWASYLSGKSTLDSANATMYSLQSTMYTKWNTYNNLATNSTYQNTDGSPNDSNRTLPQFTTAQDDWLAAEAAYKNQQGVIAQAQAALNSASLSYQAASNVITAPMAGTIADLTITQGTQIGSPGSTSTGSTNNLSTIATIKTEGNPTVTVNLSETDAAKVKSGQKATITLDALPNKSFTGRVFGINTTGVVSSGVTTYPATIQLDIPNDSILPNMSATANIILDVKSDVLLVPSGAVQLVNGESTVRVLQNGKLTSMPVEVGNSSDTQTEITSGLNEGDTIVTGFVSNGQASGSSPFSGGFRMGGFGGGNAVFRGGGGR
ncbi:MAG: efflux RND transporter periplasmic adaptor subunit [Patescibacteria group bacterium]|nr:efflux RND transporter periplasmic adaptor subunit [Patescibacteria group bacterium]